MNSSFYFASLSLMLGVFFITVSDSARQLSAKEAATIKGAQLNMKECIEEGGKTCEEWLNAGPACSQSTATCYTCTYKDDKGDLCDSHPTRKCWTSEYIVVCGDRLIGTCYYAAGGYVCFSGYPDGTCNNMGTCFSSE